MPAITFYYLYTRLHSSGALLQWLFKQRTHKEKTPQLGLQPVWADSLFSPYVHLMGVGPHLISYFWSSFWSLRVLSESGRNRSAIKGRKKMGWKGGKSQVGVGWEWSEPFGELLGSSKQKLWDRVELQWGGPAYWWRGCNGLISPPGSYSWSHWRDTIKSFVCGPATDSFCPPPLPLVFLLWNTMHISESTSGIKRERERKRRDCWAWNGVQLLALAVSWERSN